MSAKLEVVMTAGEATLFDSLAQLVPDELQTAYYRVLAHTRTLSPDDEMLRILEAMGILALITRQTPKEMADEHERFRQSLEVHRQFSHETPEEMLRLVRQLESRIAGLPSEIEAGLEPKQIARMLGESLRQHFLRSGVPDTMQALQSTSAAMIGVQKELSSALHILSDSQGGVIAQVERANKRLEYSLASQAKTTDALLHEWKSDLLRIWIPMVAAASMLVGLFGGIEIQGCRNLASAAATIPTQSAVPTIPNPSPKRDDLAVENPNQETRSHGKVNVGARRKP